MVTGTTYGLSAGVMTRIPSTALSTDIAGVIMPSPYNKQAPNMPIAIRPNHRPSLLGLVRFRMGSQSQDPSLTIVVGTENKARYLMVTIIDERPKHQRQNAKNISLDTAIPYSP